MGFEASMLKQLIKRILTPEQVASLYNKTNPIRSSWCWHNLKKLARIYGSDKWGGHWYAQYYERHSLPLRKQRINLLEIGIGGGATPNTGGASLRMWASFFSNSTISGIDIYDKSFLKSNRIKVFQGSQCDDAFLERVISAIGPP